MLHLWHICRTSRAKGCGWACVHVHAAGAWVDRVFLLPLYQSWLLAFLLQRQVFLSVSFSFLVPSCHTICSLSIHLLKKKKQTDATHWSLVLLPVSAKIWPTKHTPKLTKFGKQVNAGEIFHKMRRKCQNSVYSSLETPKKNLKWPYWREVVETWDKNAC